MLETKLPNSAAHMLTLSDTAQTLAQLISTAASETFTIPNDNEAVDLFCYTNNARWLSDGNDPDTSGNGHLLLAGTSISLRGEALNKIKLCNATGGSNCLLSVRIGIS